MVFQVRHHSLYGRACRLNYLIPAVLAGRHGVFPQVGSVHLLHDYPVKAHAWSVTAEDKSVLLWGRGAVVSCHSVVCIHLEGS